MGSKWNPGCCGQCAACNSGCSVGSDTSADCCDTCGLKTSELEISATTNGSGQHIGHGCGGCNNGHHCTGCHTGCDTAADCCDTCGLTINPDGSQMVSNQGPQRPRRCLRMACCNDRRRPGRPARPGQTCAAPAPVRPDCGCRDCGQTGQTGSCCAAWPRHGCNQAGHSAMMFHQPQPLNETYATENALFQGTLYPELEKPMAAVAGCSTANCATRRQLEAFEAWELRLYLDTHPHDAYALERWQQLCEETCEGNYATAFTGACGQGQCWRWVKDPWPWEYQPCGGESNCNN